MGMVDDKELPRSLEKGSIGSRAVPVTMLRQKPNPGVEDAVMPTQRPTATTKRGGGATRRPNADGLEPQAGAARHEASEGHELVGVGGADDHLRVDVGRLANFSSRFVAHHLEQNAL